MKKAALEAGLAKRNAWLRSSDEELLRDCREERHRASGPGGQRRNKAETAIRLHHEPSGVSALSSDSRSLDENRRRAVRRLREKIAFEVRSQMDLAAPALPDEFVRQRGAEGKLHVNTKNPAYPVVVATALDALAAAGGSYSLAAEALGITSSQLQRFFKSDRELWRAVSEGLQTPA
jgi:hypothetical protein